MVDFELAHNSANHYNKMIWTIFSVGIISTFTILYLAWNGDISQEMILVALSIGFMVLVYSTLLIEQFGQRKRLMLKIFNESHRISQTSNLNLHWEDVIDSLPHLRVEWLSEIILSMFFLSYTISFYLNEAYPLLSSLTLIIFGIVIYNWVRRPGYEDIIL